MTITAAYLVPEGLVLGADSTTTMSTNQGEVVQLLNHAQKLFEVGPHGHGRFALCTWGAASVGPVSHRTIAARLHDRVTSATSVAEALEMLIVIVQEEHRLQGEEFDFGYFFGGTDTDTRVPRCHVLRFRPGKAVAKRELKMGEVAFEGIPIFFQRIAHGIDPRLVRPLLDSLSKRVGSQVPNFEQVFVDALNECLPAVAWVGERVLPLREAIDFVYAFLHVTVKAFKFQYGAPVCGGPIEIGFISADRPFRWARHKPFDAAILEPEALP